MATKVTTKEEEPKVMSTQEANEIINSSSVSLSDYQQAIGARMSRANAKRRARNSESADGAGVMVGTGGGTTSGVVTGGTGGTGGGTA